MIKKIILVFKSHFDIGFTDLAENVIRNYGSGMLSRVIETCRATEHMGALKYVWTMPAWPLRYILSHCDSDLRPELERLIRNGQIVWHALPFTTHTDCCAPEEYTAALQYSRELSERFQKPYPIAGKMTDVPGHGLMLPELLSQAGIRFLHLGCNEFATPPDVPRLFFWKSPQGGRVLTMYSKGGYGTSLLPPKDWPFPVWMALMHTNDNSGPQTADIITDLVRKAKLTCPEAEILCGTMDDFCLELERCDLSDIPVITDDLADTWIHGVGSYPKEVSALRQNRRRARELHRYYAEQILKDSASIPEWERKWDQYYEQTALFEEHTWGADVKTWLGPDRVYEKEDFLKARLMPSYQFMERSWKEQSGRIIKASELLDSIAELIPLPEKKETPPEKLNYSKQYGRTAVESGRYRMCFDPSTGKIECITDLFLKTDILKAHDDTGVFSYRYDRAGIEDVTEFLRSYGYRFTDWGILDYGRSKYPECERLSFGPVFDRCEMLNDRIRFHYHTGESSKEYGDCRKVTLTVSFPENGGIDAELLLQDKQASPFIEAGSFIIPLAEKSRYLLGRPCAEVDPETQIIHCANHSYYCLEDHVTAVSPHSRTVVFPKDTPLMAIGSSGLYEFHPDFPENRRPELWFDLFNNMWGTNFPQWIEGDFRYCFSIRTYSPDKQPDMLEGAEQQQIPGIPSSLEPVHTMTENGKFYLMLRDHSGDPSPQTIRVPNAYLRQTDLWHRPLGDIIRDELLLEIRPYGLHCIEVSREGSSE